MTDLTEITLSDLERASRLTVRVGNQINPQFRCATPIGDHWIGIALPDDERAWLLGLLADWMALNQVVAFTMAEELADPMVLMCVGVSLSETVAVAAQIVSRSPYLFDKPVWLSREQIGDDILRLLPRGARELTKVRLMEVDVMFGAGGQFEARKIDGLHE